MFNPHPMVKVRFLVPETKILPVITKLYELKLLHLVEQRKNEEMDIGAPLEHAERTARALVKLRALKASLLPGQKSVKAVKTLPPQSLDAIEKTLEAFDRTLKSSDAERKALSESIQKNQQRLQQFEFLHALYLDLDSYKQCKSLMMFIGYINEKEDMKKKLQGITTRYKLHVSTHNKKTIIALFVEAQKKDAIETLLKGYAFTPVDVAEAIATGGTILENISLVQKQLLATEQKRQKLLKEHEQWHLHHAQWICNTEHYFAQEAEKYFAPLKFGKTKQVYVIRGWVPQQKAQELTNTIEHLVHKKVFIEEQPVEKKDIVPVLLKNPRIAQPFEFFMHLYSLPSYKELDPTFFMFLTFPLFFGLMLGDVGYGLITLVLFLVLKKKFPAARGFMHALIMCSLMSIIFGGIFGEYLGFEKLGSFEFPRLINRLHGHTHVAGYNLPTVLVIGAIFGVIHINLALLLGFINELKHHGLKHALLAKGSWYLLQIGVLLLALIGLHTLVLPVWIAFVVIACAAVMIYFGEHIQGLVELPTIFSNMLSYLRLGAIGLSSVWLAVVVNEKLAEPLLHKGGVYIAIAIIIFVLGHAINTALGILGPFLHALRLHYVEFFSKFYHGGGIQYSPFGREEGG